MSEDTYDKIAAGMMGLGVSAFIVSIILTWDVRVLEERVEALEHPAAMEQNNDIPEQK